MAIVQAKTAIRERLAGITPKLLTAFEALSFEPPDGMYQRLQFIINPPSDPTTGNYFYRENITAQIFVAGKLDEGTDPVDNRCQLVRSWFDKGLTMTFDNIRMHVLRTPQIISASAVADRVVGAVFVPVTVEVYRTTNPDEDDVIINSDFSDLRYIYLQFATYIKRIDQGVFPATVAKAFSTDWDNRVTLTYF